MSGYRPCSAGQRRNGQSGCSTSRVSYRQDRIDCTGFHNGHAHNLIVTGCAACHGIVQVCAVEGKDQLSGLRYAYLEKHKICADFCEGKRIIAAADNIRSAGGPILREADVRTGSNGSHIIGRHKRKEIRIAQHAAGNALGTGRARFALGPLRADGTRYTLKPLRTCGTRFALGTLGTGRARYTLKPLRTCGACFALRALRANGPCFSLRTDGACFALRALGANGACFALGTGCTCGTRFTTGALNALRALGALRADRPNCTGSTCFALWALGTLRPGNAPLSLRALGTGGTLRARNALRALRALRALGTLYPLRSGRTPRAGNAAAIYLIATTAFLTAAVILLLLAAIACLGAALIVLLTAATISLAAAVRSSIVGTPSNVGKSIRIAAATALLLIQAVDQTIQPIHFSSSILRHDFAAAIHSMPFRKGGCHKKTCSMVGGLLRNILSHYEKRRASGEHAGCSFAYAPHKRNAPKWCV